MRAVAAGVTDVGRERDHNEDRFVLLPQFGVYVVADGMGGHQCGEVASRMATSTIAGYFRNHAETEDGVNAEALRSALLQANESINKRAADSPVHRGMGTTIVAAALDRPHSKFHIAHAGDSRCYRLRDGEWEQLTRDHSLVEEALRTRPNISKTELAYLPGNVITRALGVDSAVDVELNTVHVELGDVFLLCSDGLHGFVTDDRIHEIVANTSVLTTACAELIAEANGNGGGDNITAVLVRIEAGAEPWRNSTSIPPPPGQQSADGEDVGSMSSEALQDTLKLRPVKLDDIVEGQDDDEDADEDEAADEADDGADADDEADDDEDDDDDD